MPIDIRKFENKDEEFLEKSEPSQKDELRDFLSYDASKAYTIREIQSSTSLSIIEIAARLGYLKERGVVRNRGRYWAISRDHTRADAR